MPPTPTPSPLALLAAARRAIKAAENREALAVLEALAVKVQAMVENEAKKNRKKGLSDADVD